MQRFYGNCLAGIDDGFFEKTWRETLLCLAIHCFYRGRLVPVDALLERVTVDGVDATDKAIALIERARGRGYRLEAVFTDTVVFAGFNILDPDRLYRETGVGIVTVNLYPQNPERVRAALVKHFPDHRERLRVLEENWARQRRVSCSKGRVIIAGYGLSPSTAWQLTCTAQVYSREPEPLYTAGLLASTASRLLARPLSLKDPGGKRVE